MININHYGYSSFFDSNLKYTGLIPARVTEVHKERYIIVSEHGENGARLKGSVYYKDNIDENYPTTGDFVLIEHNPIGDSIIVKTLKRKSCFERTDGFTARGMQTVAANFDYVFIVASLNNDFNLNRIERYLTSSWQSGGIPIIILTKSDLVSDFSSQIAALSKIAAGVDIVAVSAKSGYGLDNLMQYIKPATTLVFLGSSGTGKSSLLNALAGEEIMAVSDIREDDSRGRHTTTLRQLTMLKSGAMIIDTPGMRELGMWDVTEGLGEAFTDVEQHLGQCKFSDCKHQNEPGCAIKSAIQSGKLSSKRWENYNALKREARFSEDKAGYLRGKQQRHKDIAKFQRKAKSVDYKNTPCTETFTCSVCGAFVAPDGASSSHRNHCPKCLSSLHVDNSPGDRASLCKGIMEPIGVWVRKNGEWAIIHRCKLCGVLSSNRIAADDNQTLLMSIAVKPLAEPPFPLGQLAGQV